MGLIYQGKFRSCFATVQKDSLVNLLSQMDAH